MYPDTKIQSAVSLDHWRDGLLPSVYSCVWFKLAQTSWTDLQPAFRPVYQLLTDCTEINAVLVTFA